MANVSLKKDFRDGDKLFAQQLNNNFGAIEAGMNSFNQVNWEDEATKVAFFKGTTEEVEERPISNGQLLYNTSTGETALDDNGERIVTGSGNVVAVGGEEPENPATKLWIEEDTFATLGTEVVNSLEGNQTDKAPSVAAVNKRLDYSTEEQVVGRWMGKPLYRKTIISTEHIEQATLTQFPIEVNDIEKAWLDTPNCYLYSNNFSYGNSNHYCYTLPFYGAPNEDGFYVTARIRGTNIEIFSSKGGWGPNWTKTFTIKYTKTTDEGSAINEI